MLDLGAILGWLKYRKIAKNRKLIEDAMMKINDLSVTYHGRIMLAQVCQDPTNGLPNEVRRMYWILLNEAPVREWARFN